MSHLSHQAQMTEEELRKRLMVDFESYCRVAVKIRTKKGTIEPFVLNQAQRIALKEIIKQWRETGRVRAIVSKGRQQGMSTMIQAFAYWVTTHRKAFKSLVIAHESEATKTLFSMTHRIHSEVPDILKPSTKYSSRNELYFAQLDSGYRCATAGNDGAARGETLNFVHCSEMAFWPRNHAEDLWNGLIQSVPNMDDTFIFIESTSNGVGNLYHRLWEGAVKGTNGFIPIFIPWYLQDEYRIAKPKGFARTEYEQKIVDEYGLDDKQLMFRRRRIAETGEDQFMQEYPLNPEESFLSTGRPVFNPLVVAEYLKKCIEPLYKMDSFMGEWEKTSKGLLSVYEEPEMGKEYTIGVDVAYGFKNGDYSVAQVLDTKGNQVAVWRGHLVPDAFADVLYKLGELYNSAYIVVESNNVGFAVVNRLFKELGYPYVHKDVQEANMADKETMRLGFNTNAKTKPAIINELRAAIRDHKIKVPDYQTVSELRVYVADENDKLGAESGYHDDTVMALAIGYYNLQSDYEPHEVVDDYYVEMV